jgi:protein TonB
MPPMSSTSPLSVFPSASRGGRRLLRRRWRPEQVLWAAMAASLALHALVLAIQFRFPEFNLGNRSDRGLEVVLVNARHERAPDQAEALAQANLDGGGETESKARPSSPLPPQDHRRDGDSLQEARRRTVEAEARAQQVMTQAKSTASLRSEARQDEQPSEAPRPVSGYDLLDSSAAIARMEAQIDKSLNEMSRRPRKAFIGARTQEYRFAQYVEDWRQKIERIGTLNYPDAARGKIYGTLVLSVLIRADGSVDRVEINRSSGHKVLDEAAQRIVLLASPFAAFPPDIRRDTDILEITRTWKFEQGDQMQTTRAP